MDEERKINQNNCSIVNSDNLEIEKRAEII